ncbi:Variant Ionotropic Glutamate Receptor [Penaeus vannamei]|uniref:Variant Ionotropic Glutamate Receptor n=1 Tax=Penaeus vannamei TaxID=6689 RepID=A0A423T204_PENVA|nr:Variant Ionotropic Glutamate Receptor [Penaeus vannamei]
MLLRQSKKTKHVLGILKTGEGDWAVYMNLLYKAQPLTRLTTWRNGSFTSQKPLFPDKLNDLGGVVVKVVTFEWKPSTFNQLGRDGEVEDRFGVDIEVVRAVAKVLNFNIEFVEPPQGELWGSRMPNGSWNGMMGLLHRAEAEIAAANLYVTSRRLSVLEYTDPYDSELSCFLTRTEPPLPRWHALAFPFHLWTWLALLLSLLATGPVFYLLARNSCHVPGEAKDTHSLPFAYTYVFGVHCSRSMALLPRSPSTRIFVVFLWLYAVILTLAYSTNLTAFLIVTTSPAGVETIRELYESGKEVAGTGYFYRDELASSGDPFLQGLTDRYLSSTTVDEILKKVVSGGTVYLQNRGSLEYVRATKFSSRTLQGVRIMKAVPRLPPSPPGVLRPYSIALAVQRHSPLKEKISRAVGHLQSGGLARQYFLQSLRRAAASEGREGSELTLGDAAEGDESSEDVIPLTLDHLQGVFMLALLGWGLSCFVLLAECVL